MSRAGQATEAEKIRKGEENEMINSRQITLIRNFSANIKD